MTDNEVKAIKEIDQCLSSISSSPTRAVSSD
jgi:hypothetical protein